MAPHARWSQAGFAPTPPSVQVNPDPGGGPPQKTGTGNVTAMLDRGYIEFLFKTADTPLAQQFEAAMARYRGLHLVAFAVADAAATHARLAKAGFRLQPVVDMRRPVGTAEGEDIAAFSIVRLAPGEMPEGRIQALTHRTAHTVWQERWLSHRNGATGLLDVVIVEADVAEAAERFQRFLGRRAAFDRFGQSVTLDRGRVELVSPDDAQPPASRARDPGPSFHLCLWRRSAIARRGRRLSHGRRHCLRPPGRLHHCAVPRATRHGMLGVRRGRRRAAVAKLMPAPPVLPYADRSPATQSAEALLVGRRDRLIAERRPAKGASYGCFVICVQDATRPVGSLAI